MVRVSDLGPQWSDSFGPEPVVACKSCGHPLPADAKFCANCGRDAGPDEPSELGAGDNGADPWER